MLFIKYRNIFRDMITNEPEPAPDRWNLHEVRESDAKLIQDGTGIYQGTLDQRVRQYCRTMNISMGYSECWHSFEYELYTEENLPLEYRMELIEKECAKLNASKQRIIALGAESLNKPLPQR